LLPWLACALLSSAWGQASTAAEPSPGDYFFAAKALNSGSPDPRWFINIGLNNWGIWIADAPFPDTPYSPANYTSPPPGTLSPPAGSQVFIAGPPPGSTVVYPPLLNVNISNMSVNMADDAQLILGGQYAFEFSTPTINSSTFTGGNSSKVVIPNFGYAYFNGSNTISGNLGMSVDGGIGHGGGFDINGALTFNGSHQVTSSAAEHRFGSTSGGNLVIDSGSSLQLTCTDGNWAWGFGSLAITNNGTLDFNQMKLMEVRSGSPVTNTGELKVTNGSTLTLNGGLTNNLGMVRVAASTLFIPNTTIVNSGGLFEAQSGASLQFFNDTITGGTILVQSGGGASFSSTTGNGGMSVEIPGGFFHLDQSTITGSLNYTGGTFQVSNTSRVTGSLAIGAGRTPTINGLLELGSGTTVDNDGTLALLGAGTTRLRAVGPVTLTGDGQMTGPGTFAAANGAAQLLNQIPISGVALTGFSGGITNQATMDAVSVTSSSVTNQGILRPTTVSSSSINNAAGTIEGGSFTSSTITNLGNTSSSTGKNLAFTSSTIGPGTVTNNTQVTASSLRVTGAVDVSGSGTVTGSINGLSTADRLSNLGGSFLSVTLSNLEFVNQGSVSGNSSFTGVLFNNAGGSVVAGSGVTTQLLTETTLTGGSVNVQNGGTLRLQSATIANDPLQLQTGSVLEVVGASQLDASTSATVLNGGDIRVASATLQLRGSQIILDGAGSLTLTNGTVTGLTTGATLTNLNNFIHGSGTLGNGTLGIVNHGIIAAETSPMNISPSSAGVINRGTMRVTGGSSQLNFVGASIDNQGGILEAPTTGSLNLQQSTLQGGRLSVGGTATINLTTNNGVASTASSLESVRVESTTSRIVLNGAGTTLELPPGDAFTNLGTISASNRSIIKMSEGTYTNQRSISTLDLLTVAPEVATRVLVNGEITLTGGGTLTPSGSSWVGGTNPTDRIINVDNLIRGAGDGFGRGTLGLVNYGTLRATGGTFQVRTNAQGFVNYGTASALTGNLLLAGPSLQNYGLIETSRTLQLNGPFENAGTLRIMESGNAGGEYQFVQSAGATIVDGQLSVPTFELNGGTLSGAGLINGELFQSGGTVSPGASPGMLTITGSYTQAPGGMLALDIGGLTPTTQHDQLFVTGHLLLHGAIQVTFTNGFEPHVGDEFPLFYVGGDFEASAVTFTNAPAWLGYEWEVTEDDYRLYSLQITAVPEPSTFLLAGLGLFGILCFASSRRQGRAQAISNRNARTLLN
jgi:hypothetical protein